MVRYSTLGDEFDMRAGQHIAAAQIAADASEAFPVPCYGGNGIRGFVDERNQVGPLLLIGRQGALCGNVQRASGPLYATEHAVVVRPSKRLDIDWAFHMLTLMNLNQYATRSAQPGLAVGKLGSLPFRVPPLDEQRRIADVLDRADALRAKRSETLAGLASLEQSVFDHYFGASLRGEGPWPVTTLGDAATFYSGATPSKANEGFWNGTLRWFSPRDLKAPVLRDSALHISSDAVKSSRMRALQPGTVVVVVRGMILQHTLPVSQLELGGYINQDLKALLPREGFLPRFLASSLAGQAGPALARTSSSAHGTKRLDSQVLESLSVVRPSMEVQLQFDAVMQRIEAARVALQEAAATLDELFASLQQRAFRGDLFDSPLPAELTDAVA